MLKKAFYSSAVALSALAAGAPVFAETPSAATVEVNDLVSTSGLKDNIISSIAPWITMGLGLAVTIYLVMMGWKALKKFLGR